MSWLEPPARSGRPLCFGAAGGVLAGAGALVLAAALMARDGRAPLAVINGLGAWAVRWLQVAAPQALDNVYFDATAAGWGLALLVAGVVGAVFGGVVERLGRESPLAWGLAAGVLGWWLGQAWLVPALNPVLGRLLGSLPLAAVCLAYGVGLGLWQAAGRHLAPAGAANAGSP